MHEKLITTMRKEAIYNAKKLVNKSNTKLNKTVSILYTFRVHRRSMY